MHLDQFKGHSGWNQALQRDPMQMAVAMPSCSDSIINAHIMLIPSVLIQKCQQKAVKRCLTGSSGGATRLLQDAK